MLNGIKPLLAHLMLVARRLEIAISRISAPAHQIRLAIVRLAYRLREWVEETVTDGSYEARLLPDEGYVRDVDADGIPITTSSERADDAFFKDYFWIQKGGVQGIIRGGYWKSRTDGGLYSVNVAVPPSFTGEGVGFRCAKNADKS
jgi:hypothetical protein